MTSNESTQPPTSNKGGNTLNELTIPTLPGVSINLDWLRYTSVYNPAISEADNLRIAMPRFAEFKLTGEELPNGRGFNRAQQLTIGVVHWHTTQPDQGVSVELTGRDLGASRQAAIPDESLLAHIAAIHGRVSTMDSAVDVYNHRANPNDILLAKERGELRTNVKSIGQYKSTQKRKSGQWKHAETVYIGSPSSERQMKVYNKGAQLGLDADWVRIEMRWRGLYARAAHVAMLQYGIEQTTRSAILSMADYDGRWWRAAMDGDLAKIEPISRPETKTLEWLLGVVFNTLERELDGQHKDVLIGKFAPLIDKHRGDNVQPKK